ncbi:MAG TPA: (Fe-S)-binding protein [Thermoplasmata archaeon]|nr:(Fe-S)-binding protein [Thermoplasmata archaeon]
MADGSLRPTSSPLSPLLFDDDRFEELCSATNAQRCFQCGTCTATCPIAEVSPFRVRKMIRLAQYGVRDEGAWRCTTCAECNVSCPRGVDIVGVVRHLRARGWKERRLPAGLSALMWGIYSDGNPFRLPPGQRAGWLKGLDIPGKGETVLYVGCASSYDPRAQKIARAVAQLLYRAGVDFKVLGENEVCCGETPRALGVDGLFDDLQEKNTEMFRKEGARRVITISPHCFDALRAGQRQEGAVEVLHYSQALETLVDDGKLRLERRPLRATYHDPCYLGRVNGVYEQPRKLLELAGATLEEMPRARAGARCCGGGGGRMWMETPAEERIADGRVLEARATGAEVLATTCPYCISCFEDSAKTKAQSMRVADVSEILLAATGKGV